MLKIVGVNESTYYARKKHQIQSEEPSECRRGRPIPGYSWSIDKKRVSDEQIKEFLMELIEGEERSYGYKKLTVSLHNSHRLVIDDKKVYRLCKELGILQPKRVRKTKYPRRLANNLVVMSPNKLWQMDVKYGYVAGADRFFFLLSIIDVFDRAIVGYHIGPTCEAKHACKVVQQAIQLREINDTSSLIIRTDNGPQFVSHAFGDFCHELRITHERIPPRTPNKNAFIESFHSVLERELLAQTEFETFQEAYKAVGEYMDFYNHRRLHGKLRYQSPLTFHQGWKAGKYQEYQLTV